VKYYAVIDTNVLVSAMIQWNSVPGNVIELAFSEVIVPVYNDEILAEYRTVLLRPKFGLNETIVNGIVNEFIRCGKMIQAEKTDIRLPDPKDVVFYEVVMEERKTEEAYLVTGNKKHFPMETFVVTPRQMLDIVFSENKQDWEK